MFSSHDSSLVLTKTSNPNFFGKVVFFKLLIFNKKEALSIGFFFVKRLIVIFCVLGLIQWRESRNQSLIRN